ncbi:MAG: hypothetical protein LBJ20_05510 [Candidatus Methanoplasma sp.]|jgi:hypothetical protein|nr:hypothetical protein [Candidatus Methanoplasma sp.]
MGFTDKIKNTIQDATSFSAEKIDETNFNLKISDKKGEIEKVWKDVGALTYSAYSRGEKSLGDDVIKLCEKIKGLEDEIKDLEEQKKNKTDKARTERQNRRENE